MTAPPVARPPSPAVVEKAMRYLTEGRVSVEYADATQGTFAGWVRGSRPAPYYVTRAGQAGWRDDCPSTSMCAHVLACRAVFPEPKEDQT